jgi:hypothetical protein
MGDIMGFGTAQRMPGRAIIEEAGRRGLVVEKDDSVFLINPKLDEYTLIRRDQDYEVEPGMGLDVVPRSDRG